MLWTKRLAAEIDFDANQSVLSCPRCRGNNLHQGNTTIYQRSEDASYTTVIAQDGHKVIVTPNFPSAEAPNPSSRRHGLIIEFWCEYCENDEEPYRLAIFQHKGNTFLEWVG
jgi:hypothetical protein